MVLKYSSNIFHITTYLLSLQYEENIYALQLAHNNFKSIRWKTGNLKHPYLNKNQLSNQYDATLTSDYLFILLLVLFFKMQIPCLVG
jgi:hypothetical protein